MSSLSSFTFDSLTRIGTDSSCIDQRSIQNTGHCNYMTQTFLGGPTCSMGGPIQFATSQPGIFYKGGASGCDIDQSSALTMGAIQSAPTAKLDLTSRTFVTVPFLGRGAVNPTMETEIQQGKSFTSRRTANNAGEQSYISYSQTPLQAQMRQRLSDAASAVEEDTLDGWRRGGVASREVGRDVNQ